jgi:hypothetical protein
VNPTYVGAINYASFRSLTATSTVTVPPTPIITIQVLNNLTYSFPAFTMSAQHCTTQGSLTKLCSCQAYFTSTSGTQGPCTCSVCTSGQAVSVDCSKSSVLPSAIAAIANFTCIGVDSIIAVRGTPNSTNILLPTWYSK